MKETQEVGMVELFYFVNMMKHYLDRDWEERFWSQIRRNCPELIQAIDASFRSEYGWGRIIFTWNIPSPAFDPDLIFSAQREQLPAHLEPEQESRL